MYTRSIRSVASENLPAPTSHNATLAASLDSGSQLRCTPCLCRSSSTNNTTPILLSQLCHHPIPYFQLRCRAVPPISFMPSCFRIPSSRSLLHITLSILCFLAVATSRPTQNITLQVPLGTTNHGNADSLCIPPNSIDIASFLLFNYIAHGATVASYPGEPAFFTFSIVVAAILFPTTGVKRALNLIFRHPRLTSKSDLDVAARSGALCMLVRSPNWKPQQGDDIRNALINDPRGKLSRRGRKTGRSDPSAAISPTYVPIYSHSIPS